jgi:hypothetical protein
MMYTQETIVEKNITLSFEFERYIIEAVAPPRSRLVNPRLTARPSLQRVAV